MEGLGWDYTQAHTFVQTRRFCISLNEGFKRQLKEYEPIFQARRMTVPLTGGGGVSPGTLKRHMDDEEEDNAEGITLFCYYFILHQSHWYWTVDYSMNTRR